MFKTPAKVDCSACEARKPRVSRHRGAQQLSAIRRVQESGVSERSAAKQAGVARGTLRYWERRGGQAVAMVPAGLSALMETPEGVEWLRRIGV